jgi:fatty acid-binding protein DegV
MVDQMAAQAGEGATVSCIVLFGDCPEEMERFVERLKARLNVRWLQIMRPNPALGVHIGPDSIGVAYYRGVLPIPDVDAAEAASL